MNLENVVAGLELHALPPPGTYTYDEWFGQKPPHLCPDIHCAQKIHRSFHFCPRCGRGLRPYPCRHYPKTIYSDTGCPFENATFHDPSIVVFHIRGDPYKLVAVKCLDCGQSTAIQGCVSHALDHWNREGLFDHPPKHPFPPCPKCQSNKLVAFRSDFAKAYCSPCGLSWETSPLMSESEEILEIRPTPRQDVPDDCPKCLPQRYLLNPQGSCAVCGWNLSLNPGNPTSPPNSHNHESTAPTPPECLPGKPHRPDGNTSPPLTQ